LQVTAAPEQFIRRRLKKTAQTVEFVAPRMQHRGNTSLWNDSSPEVLASHAGDEGRLLR